MHHSIIISRTGGTDVLERVAARGVVPAAGQVLVRNRAAAVNFIDTLIRRGAMPPDAMPSLPHTLGVEGAGVVEAVGADITAFAPGDRVAWMGPVGAGGYSDYSILRPQSLAAIPHEVEFGLAAALPVNAMTAWQLLVKIARVSPGETVLVRAAAGGVGTMLVQMARHLRARVVAVCSSSKLAFVRAQGADHVLSHGSDNVAEEVLRLTDGKGVDVVCNPVSGGTVIEDLGCLAPFGRLIMFGFLAGEPKGAFAPDLIQHFRKSVGVHVSDIYTLYNEHPDAFSAALQHVFRLQADGILRPHIHSRFDLGSAGEAHDVIEQGSVMGKLILDIP